MILSKSFKSIGTNGNKFKNTVFYLDDKFDIPVFQIEQLYFTENVVEGEKVIRKFWNKYLVVRAICIKEKTLFNIIDIIDDIYQFLEKNNNLTIKSL